MAEMQSGAVGLDVVRTDDGPAVLSVTGVPDSRELRLWLSTWRTEIRRELLRHGHLLLRGLPLRTVEDFAWARDLLIEETADHSREETTARSSYGGGVFSATDAPPVQTIRLHNEDSYSVVFPGLLLFCCLVAPDTGGATTVGDSRRVLEALPVELVERFRERGWLVTRTFQEHIAIPWQSAFGTEDRAVVESYCGSQDVGWEWLPDGRLRTSGRRAATVRHPVTDEEAWFNHVAVFNEWTHDPEIREVLIDACGPDGLPQNTYYGDGSPIDPVDIAILNAAYDAATVPVRWQAGDLLLVDNILSSHGREPYTGSRQVLVAMGDPVLVTECAPSSQIGPLARVPKEKN